MQAWVIHMMGQYGALGVFFLIFIENVFPPIPSEVILAFGGFMTLQTTLSVQSVVLAATLGSVAGALVLYGARALGGAGKAERLCAAVWKVFGAERGKRAKGDALLSTVPEKDSVFLPDGTHCAQPDLRTGGHGAYAHGAVFAADRAGLRPLEHGAGMCRAGAGPCLE